MAQGELEESDSSSDEDEESDSYLKELDRPKLPIRKLSGTITAPLPLIRFLGVGLRAESVFTINGENIRSIPNDLSPKKRNDNDYLQLLSKSKKLQRWFSTRCYKEAAIRDPKSHYRLGTLNPDEEYCIRDVLAYKSTAFDSDKKPVSGKVQQKELTESEKKDLTDPFVINVKKNNLEFDSNFESGNLYKAVRVSGRDDIMSPYTVQQLQTGNISRAI